jgi:hypothetical protein
MECEGSLSCPHEPATGPDRKQVQVNMTKVYCEFHLSRRLSNFHQFGTASYSA